jgi:hypothetical protein
MQYLLTIYEDETFWQSTPPEQLGEIMAGYQQFGTDAGERIQGGNALQPTATATTVRVRDGERLVTDGPFAETKEQLGGYYLLECKDLDEAIEWATKIPGAKSGSIEVRPVMEFNEDGSPKSGAEAPASA